jgi:xylitol oxidase
MKRKRFLETTAAFTAGSILLPGLSCKPEKEPATAEGPRMNWAGNYQYKAPNLHTPETTEEVRDLITRLEQQKALGSRHCFNNIADSPLNQVSTEKLVGPIAIDPESMTVTLGAGTRYGDFAPELHKRGYALHNLASLPHISVAGACATATHGSGVRNGNLASAVAGLQIVTGNGTVMEVSREEDPALLEGMVVGLGALGIVTEITLDIEKTFELRQDVFQDMPLEELEANFMEIMGAGYSVSLFTDWQDQKISQVWIKRRTDRENQDLGNSFYGATAATRDLHPITRLSAENCTPQMGVAGPWYERLPHFKMGFTPSSGEELQSEFFVPAENALDAILALEKKGDQIGPELQITEIRSIAADSLWMSPCYQQDCIAIHFTWKQHPQPVGELISMIEAELEPFGARPHWGKLFNMAPFVIQSQYPKYREFLDLAFTHDPNGKFRNAFLNRNIYNSNN